MLKQKFKTQNLFILAVLFLLPFYFIKFKYNWVSLNLVEILIIGLFLFWILDKEKKFSILNSQFSIPVGLIFTGLFLSAIVGKNYYVGLGAIKGWYIFPILFAIIFYNCLKRSEKLLDWSLWALFCSGVLVSIEGIYYWLSGLLTFDGRLRVFYDSPNQLAMFLAVPFLIGIFLLLKETEKNKKTVLAAGWLLVGLNLYLTFSYGAWLSLAAVAIISMFLIMNNKKTGAVWIVLLLILLASLFFFQKDNFLKTRISGERSSLASREMIWKSAGLMIKNNPLFGIGPGNFQGKYLEYQKYFPPYLEWAVPQPHNLYLAFWLESGLLGFVGFIWLLAVFFQDNKRAITLNCSYGILYFAIMLYFLIHGLFDTTYWRNDLAIVFWWVVAANFYLARSQKDSL